MNNVFATLRDMGDDAPLLYIINTGAGAGLQRKAWDVPGISNFFVGACFPYATEETMGNILGFTPEKFVSVEMAIDLAMEAYKRAWKPGRKAVGIGMTCSVASTKSHRGDHRIIVASFSDVACWYMSVVIPKGDFWTDPKLTEEERKVKMLKQRVTDGELADSVAELLLCSVVGDPLDTDIQTFLRDHCGNPEIAVDGLKIAKTRIMAHPFFRADGTRGTSADIELKKTAILPGAFNPPHEAHFKGAQAAVESLAFLGSEYRKVVYSTTVNPPHKAALSHAEMLQRAKMMKGQDFILTEDDPLFLDKVRKFPGAHFIIGADTMERMLDPKWGVEIDTLLDTLNQLEAVFHVPNRLVGSEVLYCQNIMARVRDQMRAEGKPQHTYERILRKMFHAVNFRLDLSSTELRAKAAK